MLAVLLPSFSIALAEGPPACNPCEEPNDPKERANGGPLCVPKSPDYKPCTQTFPYDPMSCGTVRRVDCIEGRFGRTEALKYLWMNCVECCNSGSERRVLDGDMTATIDMVIRTQNRTKAGCAGQPVGTPVQISTAALAVSEAHELIHCDLFVGVVNRAKSYFRRNWTFDSESVCKESLELTELFLIASWNAVVGHPAHAFAGTPCLHADDCGIKSIRQNCY